MTMRASHYEWEPNAIPASVYNKRGAFPIHFLSAGSYMGVLEAIEVN